MFRQANLNSGKFLKGELMKSNSLVVLGLFACLGSTIHFTGCTQGQHSPTQPAVERNLGRTPIVQSTKVKILSSTQPSLTPGIPTSNSIQVTLTLNKEAILN